MPGMNEASGVAKAAAEDTSESALQAQIKDLATLAAKPDQKFNQPAKFESPASLEAKAPAWPIRNTRILEQIIEEWFTGVALELPPLNECHPLEHVRANLPKLVKALAR